MALKYSKLASERPGYHWAWLIFDNTGELVGKCQAARTSSGTVYVDLWDYTEKGNDFKGVQQDRRGGYGYDKIANALQHMRFAGGRISDGGDHWGQLEDRGFKVHQAI